MTEIDIYYLLTRANQLTGFYIIATLAFNELITLIMSDILIVSSIYYYISTIKGIDVILVFFFLTLNISHNFF